MKFFQLNKKKEVSDEELLESLKTSGDQRYFHTLYERYMPLIYGLCLKYLKDGQLAQDAVIDIYENLAPKITNYQIDIFKNWIYSVSKNHCFALLREKKKEIVVDFDSNIMESDSVIALLDEQEYEDKTKAINECIELLPDPQRTTIIAFFYESKSYAEIVESTGFSLKGVKSYLQNGRRNLKICLEKKIG